MDKYGCRKENLPKCEDVSVAVPLKGSCFSAFSPPMDLICIDGLFSDSSKGGYLWANHKEEEQQSSSFC